MKKRCTTLFFAAAVVCITCLGIGVKASWNWGYEHISPAGTAGQTFYTSQGVLSWNTYVFTHVCGGDVQAHLMEGTTGLSDAFVYSTSRKATVILQEMDDSSPTNARKYEAYSTASQNYNHPGTWNNTYTNSATLESDGNVELRLSIYISTNSEDTSTAVNTSIFTYEFGVRN